MERSRRSRIAGPLTAATCTLLLVWWLASCSDSTSQNVPFEATVEASRLMPIGLGECVLGTTAQEALTEPHPGPPPGQYIYGPHFGPPESQNLEAPEHCSRYNFNETVNFAITFEINSHCTVQWQYQYIDADGFLVGSPTPASELVQFDCEEGGGGAGSVSFSINLSNAANHEYLLVWAVLDGSDDEAINFPIKLVRRGACGDGICDFDESCETCEWDCGVCPPPQPDPVYAQIHGPAYVPQNETCEWTSQVSGGTGSYTYSWKKNGQAIGTSPSVSTYTGASDFLLRLDVTSGGASDWDTLTVIPMAQMTDCYDLD